MATVRCLGREADEKQSRHCSCSRVLGWGWGWARCVNTERCHCWMVFVCVPVWAVLGVGGCGEAEAAQLMQVAAARVVHVSDSMKAN